jgi:hypothetical protein
MFSARYLRRFTMKNGRSSDAEVMAVLLALDVAEGADRVLSE